MHVKYSTIELVLAALAAVSSGRHYAKDSGIGSRRNGQQERA
jgi:hypothetical protein